LPLRFISLGCGHLKIISAGSVIKVTSSLDDQVQFPFGV